MSCRACGGPTVETKATSKKPYRYLESGLPNVCLIGVTVVRCKKCKDESVIIPKMGQLHEAIAQRLIQTPTLLAPEEFRFLRKNAGYPSNVFAGLLRMSPEHLSRFERKARIKGKRATISATTDKLARAIIGMQVAEGDTMKDILLRVAETTLEQVEHAPVFTLEKSRWKVAA